MKSPLTRIMVFGTFDGLHPGHESFFRQARKLAKNPFLIVSVARDKNVKRIKKRLPHANETARLKRIAAHPLVDKAVMGGITSYIPHIVREMPRIIALGYDQDAYTDSLKKKLREHGLSVRVVRLRPHKAHVYKSSLLRSKKFATI